MPTLRPIQDYSQHEVINLFYASGLTVPKGTFVTPIGSGWLYEDSMGLTNVSPVPGAYSPRITVSSAVQPSPSGTVASSVLGVTLYDTRSYDENGLPLFMFPQKAAQMDVVVSGQAVPILKRGLIKYSGIVGTPAYGSGAAVADAGDGSLKVVSPTVSISGITLPNPACIGVFMGPKDPFGFALINVSLW